MVKHCSKSEGVVKKESKTKQKSKQRKLTKKVCKNKITLGEPCCPYTITKISVVDGEIVRTPCDFKPLRACAFCQYHSLYAWHFSVFVIGVDDHRKTFCNLSYECVK